MELFRPVYYDSLMNVFSRSLFTAVTLLSDNFMHQTVAKQRNNDVHRLLSARYKPVMIA
jgi:hypothetical protein